MLSGATSCALKPEVRRQLVPAEALLQRVDLSLQPERLVLGEYLQGLLACEAKLRHEGGENDCVERRLRLC